MNRKKQSFMEGAMILMVAGVVVKIIGAIFKIPLYNVLGGQAMAYFTTAYEIYVWMYVLTTAGLPIAISRMVSESNIKGQYKNSKRILQVASTSFMVIGIIGSVFLFFGAELLAELFKNQNAVWAIRVIAPAIMFEIIMSSYRGFFQGNKDMVPTAMSQVITAFVKLALGLVASTYILNLGLPAEKALPLAAAGAISGVTFGTILGSMYLVLKRIFFKRDKTHEALESSVLEPRLEIFKRLFAITIPIAIGSSVMSVTSLVDTALIIRRLIASGQGQVMAETLFGTYSGMARTLFNLPSALIIPIGISVIPVISEKIATHNRREASAILGSTLRIAILMSMPAGFGFMFMSQGILNLLYSSRPDEVLIATPLLAMLGPSVVFVCLVSITNSILQASGRERIPVFTLLLGGTIKIITTFVLVGNPKLNIYGAPFSTFLCYGTVLTLNLIAVRYVVDELPSIAELFLKPIVASFAACGIARLLYSPMGNILGSKISAVFCIGVAALVYVVLVVLLKMLKKQDVLLLPKGDKIYGFMVKFGWMV